MSRRHVALLAATILTMALPASAATCRSLTISGDELNPSITGESGDDTGSIRTAIVGTFLWIQYGNPENTGDEDANTVSVELSPNVIGATVCDDGLVHMVEATITPPETLDVPEPVPPATRVVDLIAIWDDLIVMHGPA